MNAVAASSSRRSRRSTPNRCRCGCGERVLRRRGDGAGESERFMPGLSESGGSDFNREGTIRGRDCIAAAYQIKAKYQNLWCWAFHRPDRSSLGVLFLRLCDEFVDAVAHGGEVYARGIRDAPTPFAAVQAATPIWTCAPVSGSTQNAGPLKSPWLAPPRSALGLWAIARRNVPPWRVALCSA